MIEDINPYLTPVSDYGRSTETDPYVQSAIESISSNGFEMFNAFQKTRRNFEFLMTEISILRSDMFDRDKAFEKFVASHFTPRTMVSRISETIGENPTYDDLVHTTTSLLSEIDNYSSKHGVPTYVSVKTSTLLNLLYSEFSPLLETVERKMDFFDTVLMHTRTNRMLNFLNTNLSGAETDCVLLRNVHAHIHENPDRAVAHMLGKDNCRTYVGVIYDTVTSMDLNIKIIDAVINADESENRRVVLSYVLRPVILSIRHSEDEDVVRQACDYADRVFRHSDALDVYMGYDRATRERVRSMCSKLDNYLKAKFPHD